MTVTDLRPESWAEQSAKAEKIQAEAEAARAKTAADTEARRLANQLKAAKQAAEIAEGEAKAEEVRQGAAAKRQEAEERAAAERKTQEKAARSAAQWRTAARAIAITCVLVSLPLQMSAFWDPHAWFLLAAPLVLEGVAWALLKGAEAAIDDGRPSWHYRLGALLQAAVAAGISFAHGSHAYGMATGLGGALCSLIGPAIWDLHEHGRIKKRDGRPTRAQRRAEKKAAAEKARQEQQAAAEKEAQRKATEEKRAKEWADVWTRAVALSAALGEDHVSEPTWKRAWDDVHGTSLGDTAESIAARVAAKARAKDAAGPGAAPAKPQVESQMTPARPKAPQSRPDGRSSNGGRPPRRVAGDAPRYSAAARSAMSVAARARRTARTEK